MAQDFVIPIERYDPFIRRRVNYAAVRRAYLGGYPPLLRRTTEVVGVVALIVGIVAEGPWQIGGLVVAAFAAHRIDKLNAHLDGYWVMWTAATLAGKRRSS